MAEEAAKAMEPNVDLLEWTKRDKRRLLHAVYRPVTLSVAMSGKAGSTYVKLGQCHLKSDSKHKVAPAYVDAAHCYKKTSITGIVSALQSFPCDRHMGPVRYLPWHLGSNSRVAKDLGSIEPFVCWDWLPN
ncbi:hypothetical protein DKX38_025982 [Salix brachista]|uniref:Uncharacterized protein n=1 Tax=Salix brachista TaxID=2182728 RepID=A0A5N5JVL4_9ROSI|nr:hypothetical protein DKX38_025982 [Salix brachista]